MNILLSGAAGQLGQALRQQVPVGVELIATSRSGDPATGLLPLDLADAAPCRAAVLEHRPDWVLDGGAHTAVDRAESEPELALAVNGRAPQAFAEALLETGGAVRSIPPGSAQSWAGSRSTALGRAWRQPCAGLGSSRAGASGCGSRAATAAAGWGCWRRRRVL